MKDIAIGISIVVGIAVLTLAVGDAMRRLGWISSPFIHVAQEHSCCCKAICDRSAHCGMKACEREHAAAKAPRLLCTWIDHPDNIWHHKWICSNEAGVVIGQAWEPDLSRGQWQAFSGQAFCGLGSFTTEEAAKACVEREAK